MLFIATNNDAEDDEYSLVVLNIRDEQYNRETRPSQQWNSNPALFGGMDMHPGLEGGTWFAINTVSNKIGSVLRVMRPADRMVARNYTRGFLVPRFLDSQLNGQQFIETLVPNRKEYPEYIFVAIDINFPVTKSGNVVSYYTNAAELKPSVSVESGVYAFGNNLPHKPWIKTQVGRDIFASIVSRYEKTSKQHVLCEDLFEFCNDDTEYFPDEILEADGRGFQNEHLRGLSSINCKVPTASFGTRTQTIVLVDTKGNVNWIERNLSIDNIYVRGDTAVDWPVVKHQFQLNSDRTHQSAYPRPRF